MRILITGAAGFIGSHLADHYVREGHEVHGIDNLLTGDWRNFPTHDATQSNVDITFRGDLYRIANIVQPELVFHCAASYSDPDKWHRDADTNVIGSINAALIANYHDAKIVYFQTALPPISSYAISKISGQNYIQLACPKALVCRLANMYGPRNVSGPIPAFYKRLAKGEACTVVRTKREMVYISDLIDAVDLLVDKKHEGVVDICTGSPVSIREIYDAVARILDVDIEPTEIDPEEDDVVEMDLDPEPIRMLGWHHLTRLEEGVEQAVRWYAKNDITQTYTHLRIK